MVQRSGRLDGAFSAIADATRRGILEVLADGDASISELAGRFDMTLTGMKKHVQVLEDAGLVSTEKVGRIRTCRIEPHRLELEMAWIDRYRHLVEQRFDRLAHFLHSTDDTGDSP